MYGCLINKPAGIKPLFSELETPISPPTRTESLTFVNRFSLVGGLLKSDGYLKFKDYGQLTTPDFTTKDVQIGFGYSNSDDGSGFAGLFLSVSNGSARFQIKSNLNAPQLKFRQTNFNNDDTTGWIEIKI